MKVATFNCNSIRTRLDTVLGWAEQHQPDFLCLQETKTQDETFPRDPIEAAGWHVAFKGEKAYNGVAILSRMPADEISCGLDSAPEDPARLLHARYGKLHIVNTYVPQGREIDHPMYAYKLAWFARLKVYFQAHFTTRTPLLWCGDLNVARHPLDVSNPETKTNHVCYHHAAREAFEETIAFGFTDVFRKHNPDLVDFSFYDYRSNFNPANKHGWRIDYVMGTPPLAKSSTASFIDITPRTLPKPSDHVPLVAEFAR